VYLRYDLSRKRDLDSSPLLSDVVSGKLLQDSHSAESLLVLARVAVGEYQLELKASRKTCARHITELPYAA